MEIIRFDKKYQDDFNGEITNLHIEVSWLSSRNGTSRGIIVLAKFIESVTISDYIFFEDEKELLENCPTVESLLHHFKTNHAWRGPDRDGNQRMLAMVSLAGTDGLYCVTKNDTPHIFYGT